MITPRKSISSKKDGAITTAQKNIMNGINSVGVVKSGIVGFTDKVVSNINEIIIDSVPPASVSPRQQNVAGITIDSFTGFKRTATCAGILTHRAATKPETANATTNTAKDTAQ